jgi:hypothetical protein
VAPTTGGKPDHQRSQPRLGTLRLHDQGRRHRRIVHRPTVPHRGNWVGRLSFRSRSPGPAPPTGTPATAASSGSPWARDLVDRVRPHRRRSRRQGVGQLLRRGAARRPRPQSSQLDGAWRSSQHGSSRRSCDSQWSRPVPTPGPRATPRGDKGDEHRPVETHSDPRVHHHPDRHGARPSRPAGGRSTSQRVRRPSRAARADRRRPCRPPARGPDPRR